MHDVLTGNSISYILLSTWTSNNCRLSHHAGNTSNVRSNVTMSNETSVWFDSTLHLALSTSN